MKENKLEVFIGALVLAVALGFVVFVYQTTGLSVSNSRHYDLKADFRSADGIHVGTDVRLAGVKVGSVNRFEARELSQLCNKRLIFERVERVLIF